MKKAPAEAGAFQDQVRERSVLRDDRATPVEAVDQLGGDRLHVGVSAIERMVRSNHATGPDDANREVIAGVAVVGEAIFALPEQAGDLADRVFGAAAQEVAGEGAAREGNSGRGDRGSVKEGGAAEARLGIAAVKIGQEAG